MREATKTIFDRLRESAGINQSPIFVVGYPRSGTTLLQSLVAAQGAETFPETHFFSHILKQMRHREGYIAEDAEMICRVVEEKLTLSDGAKAFIGQFEEGTLGTKTLFETIVLDHLLHSVRKEELSATRWLEKTPEHALHMRELMQWYPAAKFVFILRHPVHVFASWRTVSEKWGIRRFPVERYCAFWQEYVDYAERFADAYPDAVMFTRLEDVTGDAATEIERIVRFLGMEFSAENLEKRDAVVKRIVLSQETWKADVKSRVSTAIAERMDADALTRFERYRIESKLAEALKKYYPDTVRTKGMENDDFSFEEVSADLAFYERRLLEEKARIRESEAERIRLAHMISTYDEAFGAEREVFAALAESLRRFYAIKVSAHPLKKLKACGDVVRNAWRATADARPDPELR